MAKTKANSVSTIDGLDSDSLAAERLRSVQELAKAPKAVRLDVLRRAGIIDDNGKLTAPYRLNRGSRRR